MTDPKEEYYCLNMATNDVETFPFNQSQTRSEYLALVAAVYVYEQELKLDIDKHRLIDGRSPRPPLLNHM